MPTFLRAELISALQTAIGPVILISGIGLLLLTMTNRLGRAIDRARLIATNNAKNNNDNQEQIKIIYLRARILRQAILLASTSALCAALLVIFIFVSVLMKIELGWLLGGIFILGMTSLIGALLLFIRDVNQALHALKLELFSDNSPLPK
ncbi:MAG: DUF2721 domain-containing protein [Elusimicrobiota bacterium]